MPTLKEQLAHVTGLKHRLAVWEAAHALLEEQFMSKDQRKASKAIRVPNCVEQVVSEETIDDVLKAIGDGPILDLKTEIDKIENQQVVVLGEENVS